jgi:hypothetical protein
MLEGKRKKYQDWSEAILYRKGNQYWEYYKAVADNLIVNDNYNFLPKFVCHTNWRLYEHFIDSGWIETDYGIIESLDALKSPIGLYEWR